MVKIDENGNKVNVWTESHMDTTTLEIPSLRGGHRPTWQSHVILRFPRFARNDGVGLPSLRGGHRPTWQSHASLGEIPTLRSE